MTALAENLSSEMPALVLFGRDEAGKAHASHFLDAEVPLARKAATLMGVSAMPLTTEADRELAAKVPRGRIFGTGKAFLPFVKAGLYEALESAALKAGVPMPVKNGRARGIVEEPVNVANQPTDWGTIAVGSIVLAASPPRYLDWFECVVTAVEGDDVTLRYCDWPDEPSFIRSRSALALLHPTYEPQPPLDAAS